MWEGRGTGVKNCLKLSLKCTLSSLSVLKSFLWCKYKYKCWGKYKMFCTFSDGSSKQKRTFTIVVLLCRRLHRQDRHRSVRLAILDRLVEGEPEMRLQPDAANHFGRLFRSSWGTERKEVAKSGFSNELWLTSYLRMLNKSFTKLSLEKVSVISL